MKEDQLQWLVSAYSLSAVRHSFSFSLRPSLLPAQGCLLLFFGRLADIYGRKKAFMIGTLCQVVFSLGGGFAQGECHLSVGHFPPFTLSSQMASPSLFYVPFKASVPPLQYRPQ
jgi:MFS family permease